MSLRYEDEQIALELMPRPREWLLHLSLDEAGNVVSTRTRNPEADAALAVAFLARCCGEMGCFEIQPERRVA